MSVFLSKIAGGHCNLKVAGFIFKIGNSYLRKNNAISTENIAFLNGNDRILPVNGAILRGDNAIPKGNNAILNDNNAFSKDEGAFLNGDNAFPKNDNAFPKNDGSFLKDNGGFLKDRTREFAQKCTFWGYRQILALPEFWAEILPCAVEMDKNGGFLIISNYGIFEKNLQTSIFEKILKLICF